MKGLQQIKDDVAKGLGYHHWNELLHWEAYNHHLGITLEKAIDQVSVRYAQSQTQALTKQYEDLELSNILLKDQVIHLQNDLGYREILLKQLIEQKRELVDMLELTRQMCIKRQFPSENELKEIAKEIEQLIKSETEG